MWFCARVVRILLLTQQRAYASCAELCRFCRKLGVRYDTYGGSEQPPLPQVPPSTGQQEPAPLAATQHLKPCAQHWNPPVPFGQHVEQPLQTGPEPPAFPAHTTGTDGEHSSSLARRSSGGARLLPTRLTVVHSRSSSITMAGARGGKTCRSMK